MQIKHMKLRAIHQGITSCEGKKSKELFKAVFGKEYESKDDLKLIINEANRLNDKMSILERPKTGQSMTFSQLVTMIETIRNLPIDRKLKLFEFKNIYETELSKNG